MQRRIVSLVTFFSFFGLIVSSIILYVVPEGRVAYWANWKLFMLTKGQWSALHITGGILFLIAAIWHLMLNWKAIVHYMKRKATENAMMPIPVVTALGITIFIYIGTLSQLQPMEQLLVWNERIKTGHAVTYGDPPYGRAELSTVEKIANYVRVDAEEAVERLKAYNLSGEITGNSVLLEIARENNIAPQDIYLMIRKAGSEVGIFAMLPESLPEGTGKRSLRDFCRQYDLPLADTLDKLKTAGITANPDDNFRTIAEMNGKRAKDVYSAQRR